MAASKTPLLTCDVTACAARRTPLPSPIPLVGARGGSRSRVVLLATLYIDPRAAVAGSYASLPAGRIVVDGERALVGSANFTDRAQSRNVEAGVLVDDRRFAEELARQFQDAVGAGLFVAA